MNAEDRRLGMDRPITRRDFVSGVSVAIGGALVSSKTGHALGPAEAMAQGIEPTAANYPPMRTGLRGAHPGSFEAAHAARGASSVPAAENTQETYDLIVVGGGLSGLAAAFYFRKKAGPSARILVLDNHDDFGGHAKRNEYVYNGRLLMTTGGSAYMVAPSTWTHEARADPHGSRHREGPPDASQQRQRVPLHGAWTECLLPQGKVRRGQARGGRQPEQSDTGVHGEDAVPSAGAGRSGAPLSRQDRPHGRPLGRREDQPSSRG